MADSSVKELVMVFETQTPGRYYTMRYRNPKDGITTEEIQNFMQWVIDQNMFLTPNGELTGIHDGGVVERTFTDLIPD